MSKVKQLIEKAIEKKPLDIKEMVDEIMRDKVKQVVAEATHGFEYEDELTEEQETEAFFAEFNAEYGHLPLEEQEQIMNDLMSDDDGMDEFFAEFHEQYGHLSEEEQAEIMEKLVSADLEEGCKYHAMGLKDGQDPQKDPKRDTSNWTDEQKKSYGKGFNMGVKGPHAYE
jgi:hypothetical protein